MPQEEKLRIGTLDLNRVFGALEMFTELKKQMEDARLASEQEMKKQEDALRSVIPADRQAQITELHAWRKNQANELYKMAREGRARIVAKIKEAVRRKAEEIGLDLVLDSGEVSTAGTPVVFFARPEFDITDHIIAALNGAGQT